MAKGGTGQCHHDVRPWYVRRAGRRLVEDNLGFDDVRETEKGLFVLLAAGFCDVIGLFRWVFGLFFVPFVVLYVRFSWRKYQVFIITSYYRANFELVAFRVCITTLHSSSFNAHFQFRSVVF